MNFGNGRNRKLKINMQNDGVKMKKAEIGIGGKHMKYENDIIKSTRHQKIIGNYGESLICNWLSRSNYEVSVIDHTGIDIIGYNRKTGARLGITVKSRTRLRGTEKTSITIFKDNKSEKKVKDACKAFACEPWIGIYMEAAKEADIYLTSLKNYNSKYRKLGNTTGEWKMSGGFKEKYEKDSNVIHIHITFEIGGDLSMIGKNYLKGKQCV